MKEIKVLLYSSSLILKKALEINYITEQDITILKKWNKSPGNWG